MNKEKVYKEVAEQLWGLLDDIDTLTDVIKPTSLQGYARFYQAAVKRAEQRHLILISDGYSLHIPKPCAQEIVEEIETNTQQHLTQAEIKCAAACSLQHGGVCEVGKKCDQYKPFTSAVR